MKAYLSFRLPEEREEFELAQRAGAAEIVLEDIDDYLRDLFKYENKELISIEELRTFIHDLKKEYNIP
jgi:hypothetical protein